MEQSEYNKRIPKLHAKIDTINFTNWVLENTTRTKPTKHWITQGKDCDYTLEYVHTENNGITEEKTISELYDIYYEQHNSLLD